MQNISQPKRFSARVSPNRNGLIEEFWLAGRDLFHADGLRRSTRDEAVRFVAHYLFYGDPTRGIPAMGYGQEEERGRLLLSWYERAYPEFRYKEEHVTRCVYWDNGKERLSDDQYTTMQMANDKRRRLARARIIQAVEDCRRQDLEPTQTQIARLSRCHPKTVRAHRDIWDEHTSGQCMRLTRSYRGAGGTGRGVVVLGSKKKRISDRWEKIQSQILSEEKSEFNSEDEKEAIELKQGAVYSLPQVGEKHRVELCRRDTREVQDKQAVPRLRRWVPPRRGYFRVRTRPKFYRSSQSNPAISLRAVVGARAPPEC